MLVIIQLRKVKLEKYQRLKKKFLEFQDAHAQNFKVMELIELSDLLGAVEEYIKKYNTMLKDLKSLF